MGARTVSRLLLAGLLLLGAGGGCSGSSPSQPGSTAVASSAGRTAAVAPSGPPATTPPGSGSVAATLATGPATITLSSPAVQAGRLLTTYRCEPRINGVEASIPLAWSGVPAGAVSLAIEMHHYPFPGDTTRVSSYLLLWGIPPSVTSIPHGGAAAGPWFLGANKDGAAISYSSPCSQGSGTHEYTVVIYALGATPSGLPTRSSKDVTYAVLMAAIGAVPILATGTLTFLDTTP